MVHSFHLPQDLYFWGQDRMGSVIPMLAQMPFKWLGLSALSSESFTHYLILVVGFLCISFFFKSDFIKLLFALIWFLPPEREIDITQLTLSIQYVFLFIGIYLIWGIESSETNKRKFYIRYLLGLLSFVIAVWDSDLAIISVAIFLAIHFISFINEKSFKELFLKADLYLLVLCTLLGILFITYAKTTSVARNDYTLLSSQNEIVETITIFLNTLKDIFLFNVNEKLTSVYSYLVVILIILMILFVRKVKFSNRITKRLMLFFLIEMMVVFIVIIITKWTYLNGVPRRYFNCTYISLSLLILLLLENMDLTKTKLWVMKYTLLFTIVIGSFGTIYTLKYIWYPSFKPYADYMDEIKPLGKVGIIADYWNAYICSVKDPDNVKSTPHDKSSVRNQARIEEVFQQPNIYLISDGWLNTFPDTITQFGKTLVKQSKPVRLANANLCRYELVEKAD